MGNQCSSPNDVAVQEPNKATGTSAVTKTGHASLKAEAAATQEKSSAIPATKEQKPETKTTEKVDGAPVKKRVSIVDAPNKSTPNVADVQVEVKVHPEQAQHQEKIRFAETLVTDILTEASHKAVTQLGTNGILPPFLVVLQKKKLNNFQQKIQDLLSHDFHENNMDANELHENIFVHTHKSAQQSLNGQLVTLKPLLMSSDQKKKNQKAFAESVKALQEVQEPKSSSISNILDGLPDFINQMLENHKKVQKELEPIIQFEKIHESMHEICQSNLKSSKSKMKPFTLSPASRKDGKKVFQNFVKDSNNLITANADDSKTPNRPVITAEQIEKLMSLHETIQKLLSPQHPMEKIHQSCQQIISNEKVKVNPIVATRSQREDGHAFVRNLVQNSTNENGSLTPAFPELPADFGEQIFKQHQVAQKLFQVETDPHLTKVEKNVQLNMGDLSQNAQQGQVEFQGRLVVDMMKQNDGVDPAPLPPHLVRKALDDLKKINLLAQESVQSIGRNSQKSFKIDNVQENLDYDAHYSVIDSPANQNQNGESRVDPEALYATVNKPRQETTSSKFAVSFADKQGIGSDEETFSEVSLKRKKLMNRKQTGLFSHKDLENSLDYDDDEEEHGNKNQEISSESDSDSAISSTEPTFVTPEKIQTNGSSRFKVQNVTSDVKKEEKVVSPTRGKLGSLIAKFEQGK